MITKKFRKLTALVISSAMLFGSFPRAFAEGEVVYTYQNDEQTTVNVTEADIVSGNWNSDYMSQLPIEAYENFPMMLEKNVHGKAQLKIYATYLKNVRDGEHVNFEMTDRDTGDVFYSQKITAEKNVIVIDNIPPESVFNLVINSEYGGEQEEYRAVIRTYYGQAVMPEYISLYEDTDDTTQVRIKDMTLGNVYTEDENGEAVLERNVTFVTASELKNFYNGIEDDHLYDVQVNDGDLYRGYMSKAEEYSCAYVFAPTYDYYLEEDFVEKVNKPQVGAVGVDELPEKIRTEVYANGVTTIQNQTDMMMRLSEEKIAKAFRLRIDYSGEYSIKSYSNTGYTWYYGTSEDSIIENVEVWKEVADVSKEKRILYADEQYLFVIGYAYSNLPAEIVFDICYREENDDESNFVHEVNNESKFVEMDVELNRWINYSGDVDVYMPYCEIAGKYSVVLNNGSNIEYLDMMTYVLGDDGVSIYEEEEASSEAYDYTIGDFYFYETSRERSFVAVYDYSGMKDGQYTIEFRTPKHDDPYERNNIEAQATDLTTLTAPIKDATISMGDKDIYKVDVGPGGAEIEIEMLYDCEVLKPLWLYAENGDLSVTGEIEGNYYTLSATLPENDTYYLWIWGKSASYCPGHTYRLWWKITSLNPYTITMKRDVELEMEAGAADTAELLMPVAQAITCTNNGATVNTTNKMANMQLYYEVGGVLTEITDDNINSIPIGTYNVTAKLYGIDVTGKTITLTVY